MQQVTGSPSTRVGQLPHCASVVHGAPRFEVKAPHTLAPKAPVVDGRESVGTDTSPGSGWKPCSTTSTR